VALLYFKIKEEIQILECRSCRTELNENAVRCSACQSWQNWRSYTEVVALILGLVISLSALYGGVIHPIYKELALKSPDITVQIIDSKTNKVSVMVANKGDAPAGIKQIYFHLPAHDADNDWYVPVGKKDWGTLLEVNEVSVLHLEDSDRLLPVVADEDHEGLEDMPRTDCNLVLEYTSFQNDKFLELDKKYDCYAASMIPGAVKSKKFN
jgi:hypothetical protein